MVAIQRIKRAVRVGAIRAERKACLGSVLGLLGLLLLAGSSACSTDDGGGGDNAKLGRGGACTTQDQCFACEGCRLAYDEVCVGGTCWLSGDPDASGEPIDGSYLLIATFPDLLDRNSVVSAAVRIFDAQKSDGGSLSCAALLADPLGADTDPTLNLLRKLEPRLQIGTTSDQTSIGVTAGVGVKRIFLVRLHDKTSGEGKLLAIGCLEQQVVELGVACTTADTCGRQQGCELPNSGGEGHCGPTSLVVPLELP